MNGAFINRAAEVVLASMLMASPAAVAAEKEQVTETAKPEQEAVPVYPCFDMMKDGHMMQMLGTWHDKNMMMYNADEVKKNSAGKQRIAQTNGGDEEKMIFQCLSSFLEIDQNFSMAR